MAIYYNLYFSDKKPRRNHEGEKIPSVPKFFRLDLTNHPSDQKILVPNKKVITGSDILSRVCPLRCQWSSLLGRYIVA